MVDEVDALQSTNLTDALIRPKAKLSSKAKSGTSTIKRPVKHYFSSEKRNVWPHLNGSTQNPRPYNQPTLVQANALPMNQSGHMFQCYECQEWGHNTTSALDVLHPWTMGEVSNRRKDHNHPEPHKTQVDKIGHSKVANLT